MVNSSPVDKSVVYEVCKEGKLERLKELVEYTGTNFHEVDEDGNSPLHYAALSENAEVARYLVERCSFSPRFGNKRGVTPYDVAFEKNNKAVLDFFEEYLGFSYEEGYHNPVERGFFPDPSCIRVGNDYYMVNSTFHLFPCIPISHSTDLVHWNVIGYAITNKEWARIDDKDGGRGYWAPDISYSDGRFYITATLRGNDGDAEKRVQMVTSSVNPEGPYDEPAWIHEDGIDSSIFHDTDGRKYMLINRGARIFELSSDCRRQLSSPKLLWLGEYRKNPEGPHIFKRNGYYYLFLAEGGTGIGHRVTCARSKELFGVYEPCPYNPIVRQTDENQILQCCGHGMPVDTPDGKWYMVYLTLRHSREGLGMTGRESCLDEMIWTSDGWPLVNKGKGPGIFNQIPKSTGSTKSFNIDYVLPHWKNRVWMSPRSIEKEDAFVKNDELHIVGHGYDFFDKRARSALLERQSEFALEAELELDVPELMEGESVGVLSYYDENSYIEYGIGLKDGLYGVAVKAYVDDRYIVDEFFALDNKPETAKLRVEADGIKRSFIYGDMRFTLDDTSYLSSEGLKKGKRFTGATIGPYVKGNTECSFKDWKIKFIEC